MPTKAKKAAEPKSPKLGRIKITIRTADGHFIEVTQPKATLAMEKDARTLANFLTYGVRQ